VPARAADENPRKLASDFLDMNKIISFLGIMIAVAALSVSGQRLPRFAEYGVRVERVGSITVDLRSHKDARMFRTNLRNAAKEGVNFAGNFILTGWGCGTNCSEWAIIDARTGRVFFPAELAGVGFGFCDLPENKLPRDAPKPADDSSGPLYYKANSRLVVLTGFTGGGIDNKKAKCGNYFFEWTGTRLRQLRLIAGKRSDVP
jgi:hypothetical protein